MTHDEYILKHRPYCEACEYPMPAIRVAKINGVEHALCFKHYYLFRPEPTKKEHNANSNNQSSLR